LKYAAFLRAINVGGHTVKMAALKKPFEALGLSNVETFIASGNVVFETRSKGGRPLEQAIEARLLKDLGYPVAAFVRSLPELSAVAARNPFRGPGENLYIGFLAGPPPAASTKALLALATATDQFAVEGREVYWRCQTRMSESPFSGARIEKTLGMPATLRNVTTVQRMAAKYCRSE
jgi:uncharacterized protein (DUF1697 family)